MHQKKFSINFMHLALEQAVKAYQLDEVPVGAIIVKNNVVIGAGCNQVIADNSVSSHAEINAINTASQYLKNYRLIDCDLYVTLEPCHMCAKAIVDARIKNLYIGALEPKSGAIVSVDNFLKKEYLNHIVSYEYGFLDNESSDLLINFFSSKRRSKKII
tara:strand:- start:1352 stop:1828 length:477 start_codon:yes stop_codon:yes gene_type:complete